MVATHNLSFIGLIESKKEIVDDYLIKNLWPNLDFKFDFVPSVGASGGLVLIWNSVLLRNVTISKERVAFWRNLTSYMGFIGTIFISGDFNETLAPEEILNGTVFTPSMLALREFINDSEMLDLPLQGRVFTWQNSFSRSRIDRCLISTTASLLWPNMSLSALPRGQSDHVPICFRSANKVDWGPKLFRSVDAWWDHEDFSDFVAANWSDICLKSTNLIQRLKDLRQRIKAWNSEVFGDQSKRIRELSDEILLKEVAGDSGLISEDEQVALSKLKEDLWTEEKNMESLWIQKSRLKWNMEGDKNTKFYHSMASIHYRKNMISSIQREDVVFSEPKDIRFDISGLDFKRLSDSQADSLMLSFEETEILDALSSCGERKAPGPDGFNFYIYRRAWPFMKDVSIEFFADFHGFNTLPKGINTSFMVLIPKVAGSANIKDYRPISLVNGFFKLLSKILSRRLAPLLTNMVSQNQHAFIKGRSIQDCSMIANELVHLANKKEKMLVLKLDFHKAFDSID
ncbi:uncharacterized protein LOC126661785 [Mercurialis annua]|uniref:uncharacterized protein LOC126661785 n=1 Tax=Mercurialis annua TaxID=3986 RepID=UPI0021609496|nr:uncharacterized protein LOC126661785 [Mercurialis annua]